MQPSSQIPQGKAPHGSFLHATCVAFGPYAVLLRGPSGAGKSDLALRCLSLNCAAGEEPLLVADDQVVVTARDGVAVASAPERLRGLIELRGIGIVAMAYAQSAELVLVCDLVSEERVPRMPPETSEIFEISGLTLPLIRLAAFHASTPLKLKIAVAQAAANLHRLEQDRTCA